MPWYVRTCALVLLLALAACAASPTSPTPAVPEGPTPLPTLPPRPTAAPSVTVVPQPTAPPSALVLWAVADGRELAALEALVADLAGQAGAQVLVVGKRPDALVADMRADALAGLAPPDLVWGTQDDLGVLQRAGMLQPPADGLDEGAFLPALVSGATIDGQRWGTPLAAQGYLLLLFNRKLANSAPRTTDELISRARSLTVGDRYGLVAAWAEPRWFTAWLNGFAGAPLGADGRPALDTPQMLAALNLLKELRPAGPPPPSTYDEGVRLFRQGRAAFAIDGDWSLAGYREYTDTLDIGVAALPLVPATQRVAAPAFGGMYLMYSAQLGGARLDQARALGRGLAGAEAQARVAAELGRLPALRAALGAAGVARDPALAAAAAMAVAAPGLPPSAMLRCAWDAIGAHLPPVLLGSATQEQAAQAMQESADACAAAP